ncbi:DEAD/DEAH box helicase [Kurthia sibirica]|uniref:DEAD/DEAH box helicase n=1 Tax=Kurthia sibirica TaxID=202750 RepID=UPI0011669B8F|nr:DEAD/DEAH box helicase [Kurthia sibirica]GEK34271.1 helicase SNF [Kurthia sibirica]
MVIHTKNIKELCGTVSYKRGEAFFNAQKVLITNYSPTFTEATVQGSEDFHVVIRIDNFQTIQSSCSCPTLIGFDKSCQHIAAVLIAMKQFSEDMTAVHIAAIKQGVPANLDTLLQMKHTLPSHQQLHFEKRPRASVQFILTALFAPNGTLLFGMELYINSIHITNIRMFLAAIHAGIPYILQDGRTFSIVDYCFIASDDQLLKQLLQIVRDEQLFAASKEVEEDALLIIPPSFWVHIVTLLKKAVHVTMSINNTLIQPFHIVAKKPPFEFLLDRRHEHFSLQIKGFENMRHFPAYAIVFNADTLYQLTPEDSMQLSEVEQLIAASTEQEIEIPANQIDWALQKLLPSLRNIGTLIQSERFIKEQQEVPLVAELYLDRIHNKLLASIEFRYEHFTIQPLSDEVLPTMSIIRDYDKEMAILDIMAASGFSKTEAGYFMQNEEAEYHFLYHILPEIHKLSHVFATSAVRSRLAKKSTFPKIIVKVKKQRRNWLEFKFEMDGLTNKEIKEVLQAIEFKQKYYRLKDDSLLSLESREIDEIREFLLAEPLQDDHFEHTLDLPLLDGLKYLSSDDNPTVFQADQSFRQLLLQMADPTAAAIAIPSTLAPILRDYQKTGYKWMKQLASFGFGGILADTMGLGKTLQSIAYILSEITVLRENKQQILIVCPSSLTYNWLQEIMKFAPAIQAIVVDGTRSQRKELIDNTVYIDVIITSYPLMRQDYTLYEAHHYHTIFFDEAQAFKNPSTLTAKSVKTLQADHRFALTGTPVENRQEELWAIFYVVFPHLFHGLEAYSQLSRKDIARRVRPFMLRRLKEDVLLELPAKKETLQVSVLNSAQKQLYTAFLAKLKHDDFKHLDQDTLRKNRIKILAGITRLRQICCHPALFIEGYQGTSSKFEQLVQLLQEAKRSGRRVLIFSQFTKMLDIIGRYLTNNGDPYFYLDGRTPPMERVQLCNHFNEGQCDIFLISLKAGGSGLNLTGADTVILYDLWWNPAVEEQAADRAHRIGQNKEVHVIKLITQGTVEEKINDLQQEKKDLIHDIIEAGPSTAAFLTDDDIRAILDFN